MPLTDYAVRGFIYLYSKINQKQACKSVKKAKIKKCLILC